MISNSTARWAWIALLLVGCGPSIKTTDGRSPTPPAIRAEVSDPFVLPAYSHDAPVPSLTLMELHEPSSLIPGTRTWKRTDVQFTGRESAFPRATQTRTRYGQ